MPIELAELTESEHIGRWVRYTPSHGACDYGRIKCWNEKWVFVLYTKRPLTQKDWLNYTAAATKATNPKDLEFIEDPSMKETDNETGTEEAGK